MSAIEGADLEQAYWLSMLRLIKSNLSEAVHLRVGPEQYAALVQYQEDNGHGCRRAPDVNSWLNAEADFFPATPAPRALDH